ncbi:amidohydrolase [Polluticaenibacter yanchengensis]|uniref:Amidohydrolase n=1 Tax=Polluticaenibacter yanchengensis TaxID=3014562 RepID=A0ABT4UI43_9BACT|nr:amidohydrolase [Chitinophagaceae bacterium LY-5]
MNQLSISIVQHNIIWENKAANLEALASKIKAIKKTELVVLPEMFSTGFTMDPVPHAETMDGHTVQWIISQAQTKKIALVGSIIIQEHNNFYNRLILALPNGKVGTYDKRHLFAFAGEHEQYTPGEKRFITSINGIKINLQVCYDIRFPVWARQQQPDGEAEYDVLINIANWPQKRSYHWKTLLTARAIENQCYVIGVNRTGVDGNGHHYNGQSRIINPLGNTVYAANILEDVFTYTITKEEIEKIRNDFPFLKDADDFSILK